MFCLVLPVNLVSSVLLVPSIKTSTVLPTYEAFKSTSISLTFDKTLLNLSCLTSSGIWSSILAAGVPSLLEYMNVKALSYLTFSTTSIVSSKSSSVSPGNPIIKSVEKAIPGISALAFSIILR